MNTEFDIVFLIRVNNIGGSEKHTISWINYLLKSGKRIGLIQSGLNMVEYGISSNRRNLKIITTDLPIRELTIVHCMKWYKLFQLMPSAQIVWVKPWYFAGHFPFILMVRNCYQFFAVIEHSLPEKVPCRLKRYYFGLIPRPEFWWHRQKFYRRFLSLFPDHIFCVSEASKLILTAADLIPRKKISVCPNGLDTQYWHRNKDSRICFRKKIGIPDDWYLFGWVGRMVELKQVEIAIRALSLIIKKDDHLNCGLLLVGEGPEQKRLECMVKEEGVLKHVFFTGFLYDPRPAYSAMDTFLLPSKFESFPLVLLEAMACGCSAISANVGDANKLISDPSLGCIIDGYDIEKWKMQMCAFLEKSSMEIKEISKLAQQHVQKFHNQTEQMRLFNKVLFGKNKKNINNV